MNKKRAMSLGASLAAAAWLSACSNLPQTPVDLDCEKDVRGPITITYGVQNNKTIFEVKERTSVKGGKGLVFLLKPKKSGKPGLPDFKDSMVSIKGKPGPGNPNGWFAEISGSYNGTTDYDHRIGICTPVVNSDTTFEYEIHVAELGTLDPRVDVEK